MGFRFFALVCLSVIAACSNSDAPKTKNDGQTAATAPAPVKQTSTTKDAASSAAMPADVGQFVARRENCDHFRGEEAYDKERGRFIAEKLETLCKGTDAELAELKRKYASRDDLAKRLSEFENTIE